MQKAVTLGLAGVLAAALVVIGLANRNSDSDAADDTDAATSQEAADAGTGSDAEPDSTNSTDEGSIAAPEARTDPIGPSTFDCETAGSAAEIVFVYSVEKETLMDRVVDGFNQTGCGTVDGHALPSGIQMSRLAAGWPREDDAIPAPHLASPSISLWAVEANAAAAAADIDVAIEVDGTPASLGWAPLVAAMPSSVADELAPGGTISVQELADRAGTTVAGQPFVLRKTNPEVASTGLMALVAAYATVGDLGSLTTESLASDDETRALSRALEAATPVYGNTSLTVLEEMCALDNQGISPAAAVSVLLTEEQLVADYNAGRGDFGCENSGRPNEQLVAVYLDGPTPVSEHPLLHIRAPWVDDEERRVADAFIAYALEPATLSAISAELGVRDADGNFPDEDPASLGVTDQLDPALFTDRPRPNAQAIAAMREDWHRARKPFHVHFLVDLSGSMGFPADVEGRDTSRLDEVKTAMVDFIDGLEGPNDAVSITTFPAPQASFPTQFEIDLTVVDGPGREELLAEVDRLAPEGATPLYAAIEETYRRLDAAGDTDSITVLVVLTDGLNEPDGPREEWTAAQIEQDAAEGRGVAAELGRLAADADPEERVRIFTIGYGPEASEDDDVLRVFAERTFGQATQSRTSEIAVILRSIVSRI